MKGYVLQYNYNTFDQISNTVYIYIYLMPNHRTTYAMPPFRIQESFSSELLGFLQINLIVQLV